MNAFVRYFKVASISAVLAAGLVADCVAADASTCRPLTRLQQHLLDKANQGVDALRDYIFITRSIYQLDIVDVADSLTEWRARADCVKPAYAASARPTATAEN